MKIGVPMPDGRRRSRTGWADSMEAGPPDPPAHTHRLPPVVRAGFIGLVLAVFCLLVALAMLAVQSYKFNQYIQGKGEQRDRENSELQEQQRRGMCDLLDQLPEGGLLDRPRQKYGCGPGIPLSQLTPDERRLARPNYVPQSPQTSAAAPSAAAQAPLSGGAMLNPPRATEPPAPRRPTLPAQPTPTPAPTPDPVVDLTPVTDPLCDSLSLCF